ncbi:MAG: hypothetical protein KC464_34045, partial [Myxococcales bacterium]|nr:hypothetical protein [Myxococcales bacterium]
DALADDGVWSRDGDWPEVEAPTSSFAAIVHRAWWVAQALVDAPPDVERIKAALDMTPDKALARDDFQDGPYAALYWLWRSYFLGEDAWHQAVLARCKTSRSRLVRDAAAYAEAGTEALARMRAHVMGVAEHLRNPFPDRVPVGPLALVRDDSLATLEPPARAAPTFACAPGQALNASWQPTPRLAVPHPDGRRWLVDGGHDHPRKGKHPSIPSHVDALYEVDPATGQGTLFCDVPSEAYYIKWAEYLDDDHLLLINNGRLRLYHRIPAGTGRGYLIDQVPLGQEQALVMCGGSLVMGYGGVPRMLDKGWETVAERISGARVEDGRLRRTADVELGLAYIADHDGVLVGRDAGKTVGYRLEGLAASPPVTTIVLKPTAFVVPEKVWRAGPNAVLDALGPQDVCVESAAGLCLINKLVADPPGARRAYVGDGDGIRPTEPEIAIANYALVSPTVALVGNATEAFRVDLATGAATKLFEYPSGVSPEVVGDGFVVIAGADLVAYDGAGAETARVKVGDGAQLLSPLFGHRVVAMKTSTSPFALITLRDGALVLLGAVRPDGPLAGATYAYHSLPQWAYHALVKAADGTMLDLRGVDAALADPGYGLRLDGDLPARPWQAAPEITRG